ncbi:hypothetical protein PsYK624_163250 [Phanerochaete sordida]|uniref:Uncharacterized protein n=1 Tax=Phanerochaete sordida TaxID=48140 RepID=A0A9P3LNB2_9APHY|nr:hypothetical protein PsYK624_163250 [Phanerochaete sordida]
MQRVGSESHVHACAAKLIPTEVLHHVLSYAVASYFEDLVAGALEFDWQKDKALRDLTGRELRDALSQETNRRLKAEEERDRVLPPSVDALLCASYQLRHVTLQVLSKTLAIPYEAEGVGRLHDLHPRAILSTFRRQLWDEKTDIRVEPRDDFAEQTSLSPVLSTYYTIAALQREIINARIFGFKSNIAMGADVFGLALAPWLSGHVPRWTKNARANLSRCSPAMRDMLAPHVGAAVARAHVEEIFSVFFVIADKLWDTIEEHYLDHVGDNPLAFIPPLFALLHFTLQDGITRLNGLLDLIQTRYTALRLLANDLVLPQPVDEMIRPKHLRRLILTTIHIQNGQLEGDAFEELVETASEIHRMLSKRYLTVWGSRPHDPEDDADEAPPTGPERVEDAGADPA